MAYNWIKYIKVPLFGYKKTIKQKKGKFRIVYSPEIQEDILEFYELLLNPTIKAIVIVLLKSTKIFFKDC